MFSASNVPIYIEAMGHKQIKVGKEKLKGTRVKFRVDLTPELASDIPGAKRKVFKQTDGTVDDTSDRISFTYAPKYQRIELRSDPRINKPTLVIEEAKCMKFVSMKPSKGSNVEMTFLADFILDGMDVAAMKDALWEQRYVTFLEAKPGLPFAEADAVAARESKDAAPAKRGRKGAHEDTEATASTEAEEPAAAAEGAEPSRILPRRHRRRQAEQPAAVEGAPATH